MMSSPMTSAPLLASAWMLFAKLASPRNAVANASEAPGAMSWTICSIARPSSAWFGSSWSTCTGVVRPHGLPGPGRSPVVTSPAACVAAPPLVSNESESIPTLTPVPSTSNWVLATSA